MTGRATLAGTGPVETGAMNRTDRSSGNGANAVFAVDCPWCAEPLPASLDELTDGLACRACLVWVELADDTSRPALVFVEPVAA